MPGSTALPFTAPRFGTEQMKREFSNLSVSEQNRAQDDLYGKQHDLTEENEELLRGWLEEFAAALTVVPKHRKESYLKAMELCPDHVQDESFRMQFIRADYYDTRKAATRFIKYWKAKEYVFGAKAFHRLSLDDLSEDDLATLRRKAYLGLPKRDAAGRALMFSCRQKFVFKERRNILRLMFYLVNNLLERDMSLQTTGFVVIVFEDGAFDLKKYDRKLDNLMIQYSNEVWPVRFVGFHYCFDSKFQELVLPFGLYMLGKAMRARFRLHPGSRKRHRINDLAEFGITPECLPTIMGGQLEYDVDEFLQDQREFESSNDDRVSKENQENKDKSKEQGN